MTADAGNLLQMLNNLLPFPPDTAIQELPEPEHPTVPGRAFFLT